MLKSKLSVVFVVRVYCLIKDVEYVFNYKLLRDETVKVIHFFRTNNGVKFTLVNQSIKRRAVPAYFEVFCEYFGMVAARKQKLANE